MKFVGIDLHKKTIVICVVNQEKKVLERKRFLCADVERIRKYFAGQDHYRGRGLYSDPGEPAKDWLQPAAEQASMICLGFRYHSEGCGVSPDSGQTTTPGPFSF